MDSLYFVKLNPQERKMLTSVFAKMIELGIRAVILRGLIVLEKPGTHPSQTDVDILIEDGQFTQTVSLLISLGFLEKKEKGKAKIIGKKIVKGISRPQKIISWLTSGKFSNLYSENLGHMNVLIRTFTFERITLDIWEHLGHRSLLNNRLWQIDRNIEEGMINTRVLVDGLFPTPSSQFLLAHVLNRIILDKEGVIPEHYRSAIRNLVSEIAENEEKMSSFENILEKTYYSAWEMIKYKVFNFELENIREKLLAFSDY